jgi:hypothetical protein
VKRGDGTLRVIVYGEDGTRAEPTIHENISAVGVGHISKDLVLVPADETLKTIEVGTTWTRVIVNKSDSEK